MQSIINEALKNAEIEKEQKSPQSVDDDFIGQPRIMIIGCGGAGNNTVNRLHHMGVAGAETLAINTDKQHLDMIQADKRVLIGKSLTTLTYPHVARAHQLPFALLTPVINPEGRSVVRVTSSKPLPESYVRFLLQVQWPNGRLMRDYSVLLDPSKFDSSAPAAVAPRLAAPASTTPSATAPTVSKPAQYTTTSRDTLND